jgi:hypothetical protein
MCTLLAVSRESVVEGRAIDPLRVSRERLSHRTRKVIERRVGHGETSSKRRARRSARIGIIDAAASIVEPEVTMPAALEIIVLPTLLLTLIVLLLLQTDVGPATIVATALFLGLLYFVAIKLLRLMRRWDHERAVREREELEKAMHVDR